MPSPATIDDPSSPRVTVEPIATDIGDKRDIGDEELVDCVYSLSGQLCSLMRNPVYVLLVLCDATDAAFTIGIATFISKFIETQFSKSSSTAALFSGNFDPADTLLLLLLTHFIFLISLVICNL